MITAGEMRAKSRAAVEAWNARDLDEFFSAFRDDVIYHGGGQIELEGIGPLRDRYSMALRFCPDLTITTEFVICDEAAGSMASVQTESGTTSDGKPFGFRGMTFFRFDASGLIAELWEMTDPLA